MLKKLKQWKLILDDLVAAYWPGWYVYKTQSGERRLRRKGTSFEVYIRPGRPFDFAMLTHKGFTLGSYQIMDSRPGLGGDTRRWASRMIFKRLRWERGQPPFYRNMFKALAV